MDAPIRHRLVVFSDPHYAGAAERSRKGWERRAIPSPTLRWFASLYRRFFWLADPTAHNHQVDAFLRAAGRPDWVIANGDYSCDSGFIGLADDAAFSSARECLEKLRSGFGDRFLATLGDHELGKMSLFGGVGGLRIASWERSTAGLGISPLWTQTLEDHVLIGVTSSLIALPAFHPEILSEERGAWERLRSDYMARLGDVFSGLDSRRRILLFCHDPTALPFLAAEPKVAERLGQLECTIIGHLHSPWILRMSRCLSGMPELGILGNTARRLSGALRKARGWRAFRLVLCPSPPGIQIAKDGGFLEMELLANGGIRILRRRLPWRS
ncbi:MAG: metallophosphoesterase [Verrucomicrobiales bacterium]|nr:metallophosphoesterase [Verrucomicrobiales bacterium]